MKQLSSKIKEDAKNKSEKLFTTENIFSLLFVFLGSLFIFSALTSSNLATPHNDELSTVEKSFQPSIYFLINYLQTDTHPPFFYLVMMAAGKAFGQTLDTLRGLSWASYVFSAVILLAILWKFTNHSRYFSAAAFFLAAATPMAYRFSMYGKSYALLALTISLGLLFRNAILSKDQSAIPGSSKYLYLTSFAIAALTHFYGYALLLSITFCDFLARETKTIKLNFYALIAPTLWTISNVGFLLTQRGRKELGPTSNWLINETFRLMFGDYWQVTLLIFVVITIVSILTSDLKYKFKHVIQIARRNALDASVLLIISTLLISLFKPSSTPRYYIVVLPSIICTFCMLWAEFTGHDRRKRVYLAVIGFALVIISSTYWVSTRYLRVPEGPSLSNTGNYYRTVSLIGDQYDVKLTTSCIVTKQMGLLMANQGLIRDGDRTNEWICIGKYHQNLDDVVRSIPAGKPFLYSIAKGSHVKKYYSEHRVILEAEGARCTDISIDAGNKFKTQKCIR